MCIPRIHKSVRTFLGCLSCEKLSSYQCPNLSPSASSKSRSRFGKSLHSWPTSWLALMCAAGSGHLSPGEILIFKRKEETLPCLKGLTAARPSFFDHPLLPREVSQRFLAFAAAPGAPRCSWAALGRSWPLLGRFWALLG